MKFKFFIVLLMSFLTLSLVSAQNFGFDSQNFRRITLTRLGFSTLPGNIIPLSLDDEILPEVFQSKDEIYIFSSVDLGMSYIEVEDSNHELVYSNMDLFIANDSIEIPTIDWANGYYFLYIHINGLCYTAFLSI